MAILAMYNADLRMSSFPRLIFLVFSLSLSLCNVWAQLTLVEGKIVDGASGVPVPYANVYFNHTSVGAVADSVGHFRLERVPVHLSDLVFSSIGYDTYHLVVSLDQNKALQLLVKLKPQKQHLAEVEIKAKRDRKWRENYERFVREFLGTSTNAFSCEIKNAGIIDFFFKGEVLNATAGKPLEIINNALGYRIFIDLDRCEIGQDYYKISYYSKFEKLIPANEPQIFRWEIARLKTYKGSLRHFLQSVISRRTAAEGFRVYRPIEARLRSGGNMQVMPTTEVAEKLLKPELNTGGKFKNYYQFLPKGSYEIHYLKENIPVSKRAYQTFPHPVSWLESYDDFVYCPPTGNLRSNTNTMVSGEMSTKRLADALPEDYDPVPAEAGIFLRRDADFGSVRGVVVDSSSGQPLPDARVFINNSSFKANTDKKGEFEIAKIPAGSYFIVAAAGGAVSQGKMVDIKMDSISTIVIPLPLIEKPHWITPQSTVNKEDMKRNYAFTYLMNTKVFSPIKLSNPSALEIKSTSKKIVMRTNQPLEIIDQRIGYKILYYLQYAEIPKSRKENRVFRGFTSFDTLTAGSAQERRNWIANRDDFYRGTINHLMRSLVEGQSRHDGFNIFFPTSAMGKKKQQLKEVDGDSLIKKRNGQPFFEMSIPDWLSVSFQGGKKSKITALGKIKISNLGIFSPETAINIQGPMKRKAIPLLPIEFIPSTEMVTNPEVMVFVRDNDVKMLELLSEKVFLHTNKDYYYPGEKIWYKSYILYGSPLMRDTLSKLLHVELINPRKKIIRHEFIRINNGVGWGDIALPDTLRAGNYFLRAYTKWGSNYGDDHNFVVQIPILPTDLNLDEKMKKGGAPQSPFSIAIEPDKMIVKPRGKVSLKLAVKDKNGNTVPADLSIAVVDAQRVITGYWNKSIVEDSLHQLKNSEKFHRISQTPEKGIVYDGSTNANVMTASVLITSLNGSSVFVATPDKEGHFKFTADFPDTASFLFRANTKTGNFAGHISIEKPVFPEFKTPPLLELKYRDENMDQHIRYSKNPNDKSTLLEEVVVKASRLQEPPKFQNTSITLTPDRVLESEALNVITKSTQDPTFFWQLLADKIPGARSDPNALIYIRRRPATFRVNNLPYSPDEMKNLMPEDIDKIEIYGLIPLINIYLKKGPEKTKGPREFDKYTLSGYAQPTTFYMRDHSEKNPSDALPDFRTTIYWSPNVVTDNKGEANVSFYAADIPTHYNIIVQGLTDQGEPVYAQRVIEVKD